MAYQVEVELFRGNHPIDLPEECDGDHYTSVVYGTQLQFDKGKADKAIFYIARDGNLLDIITRTRDEFDIKDIAVCIEDIKQKFGA